MEQGLSWGQLLEADIAGHWEEAQVGSEQLSVAAAPQSRQQVVEKMLEGRSPVGLGCH